MVAPVRSSSSTDRDELIGGRYRILELLGRGGSSAVYRVHDVRSGDEVALKLHRPATEQDLAWSWRMRREFYLMSHLAHPSIVRVRDWGEAPPALFFTMDLIRGRDVADLAPLSPAALVDVLVALGSALGLVHARGFVHHDIKPRNVRIPQAGGDGDDPQPGQSLRPAILMDFGLLSPIGSRDEGEGIAGTPGYVSPERLLGAAAEVTDDLYALGATAYHLLTGLGPPKGGLEGLPDLPAQVPEALGQLVGDLLARDVRRRLPDVAELLERLASFTDVQPALAAAAPSYLVTPPLVGREREMMALRSAWGEAASGRGGALYVVAEPGMGKTHLLRSLALELRVAGAHVVETRGDERVRTPLGLLARLLEQLEPDRVTAGLTALPEPELLARLQTAAAGTAARPTVILVDDLQWCDDASAHALQGLGRAARQQPLLLVSAVRVESEAATWADRFARGSLGTITLAPLDLEATGVLLRRLFGRVDPPEALVTTLHAAAAGHPYLLLELARTLVDRGLAVFQAGRWQLPRQLGDLSLPATLEAALSARVARLSADGRLLARALAVAGGSAGHALLAEITELGEQRLVATEEDLEERQVVVVEAGRLRFTHPRLKEVVYASLDGPTRQAWHRRIAQVLRRQVRGAPSHDGAAGRRFALAGELGHHLARGGDEAAGEAVRWLQLAGQSSYEAGHLTDALGPLGEAAAILERTGGPEAHPELLQLWQQIGIASGTGDLRRSADTLQRLIDHLDRDGAMARVVERSDRVGARLAAVGSVVELAIRRLASQGLEGLGRAFGDAGRYLLASAYLVVARSLLGELDRGYRTLAVLERFAEAVGGDALAAPLLARVALDISRGDLRQTEETARRCTEILAAGRRLVPEVERRRMRVHALLARCWPIMLRGQPDPEGLIEQVRTLAARDGDEQARILGESLPVVHHARRGEIRLMVAARERYFERCHKLGAGWQEMAVLPTSTRALLDAGLLARAREDLRLLRMICAAGPFRDIWIDILEGSHLAAGGDPAAGLARLDTAAARAESPEVRSTLWSAQARCFAAEAALSAGSTSRAANRARSALAVAEAVADGWVAGRCRRVLTRAALRDGDLDLARHQLACAARQAIGLDNPGEAAHLELLGAEVELAAGALPAAHAAAARAQQAFIALGNGQLARRSTELLPDRGSRWPAAADQETVLDERSPTLGRQRGEVDDGP